MSLLVKVGPVGEREGAGGREFGVVDGEDEGEGGGVEGLAGGTGGGGWMAGFPGTRN